MSDQHQEQTSRNDETLGSYLKEAREKKHLSLEEAAEVTRIHVATLAALEADNREALPAEVFTRGFIKIYAQHLDLDPEEALNRYLRRGGTAHPIPEEKLNAQEILATETLAESPTTIRGRHIFLFLLLLLLAGVGYWAYQTYLPQPGGGVAVEQPAAVHPSSQAGADSGSQLAPPAEEPLPKGESGAGTRTPPEAPPAASGDQANAGQEALPSLQAAPATSSSLAQEESAPSPVAAGSLSRPEAAEPLPGKAAADNNTAVTVTTQPPPGTTVALPADGATPEPAWAASAGAQEKPAPADNSQSRDQATAYRYRIKAEFVEDTWLRVQLDGQRARQYFFHPGDHQSWQARESMQLFIGNAGGVVLTVNGKRRPPLGRSGQTVRLRFPPVTE